ncbi:hypothetical protein CACET_c25580 [Clostridium aceticum]|uniref:Uncharacterized protein n=1 Tax=Clostridium aceticum TaxID=84022 RepID=A0A0D8ICY4_9CLOT|nr:hypothetical protein [Clostridium aceticum]AKL96003.1 hypothetical protein CACET_c25580 [Clostridium aceticum]KJF27056.1 hypothetical protein TZ02_09645 [Clostridium aceticum]
MIIESSNILMHSQHKRQERYEKSESMTAWIGNSPAGDSQGNLFSSDTLTVSEEALSMYQETLAVKKQAFQEDALEIPDIHKQKMLLLQTLLEALLKKRLQFFIPDFGKIKTEGFQFPDIPNQQQSSGWGIVYDYRESYIETERMEFTSSGIIRTADGREINFSVNLTMSRSFAEHHSIHFRAGDAVVVDPLVINFNGKGVGLSEQKFSFDLTMDGKMEQISYLKPGSGFLAIDLNGDGKINDGSELFGPSTGNGFQELAQYDEDGNGWIDENDSIYDKLMIWTKDENGSDQLFALGELGIGAIYLGGIQTPFDIKDGQNQLHGQVSRSSIYVKENATVGIIQQIDLAT